MKTRTLTLMLTLAGCGGGERREDASPEKWARRALAAKPSVAALQAGRFDEALAQSKAVVAADPGNADAELVAAVAEYKAAMHQLAADLRTIVTALGVMRSVNHQYLRYALGNAEQAFASVDAHLAAAAREPRVSLELCPACWSIDWNGSGRLDAGDEKLFQIEVDERGQELPPDDPRRKPTFRFDVGDVEWARAMVSFQRALLDVLLAYRWTEAEALFKRHAAEGKLTLHLEDRKRVAAARALILDGLAAAERSRRAYLAETDDDREWVPNPRQKSHPLPLPVDDALYATWGQLVVDLTRLARGDEGLSLNELATVGGAKWDHGLTGYLDVGRMLSDPRDLVLDLPRLDGIEKPDADADAIFRDLLGSAWSPSMRPSPLPKHLHRIKSEIDRGQESFERKLKYLFWLN